MPEFCGVQHAHMGFLVIADPPAAFRLWEDAQIQPAPPPATPEIAAGEALFVYRCGACHTVRGSRAGGSVAPDLTHLMSRSDARGRDPAAQHGDALRLDRQSAGDQARRTDAGPRCLRPGIAKPAHLSRHFEVTVMRAPTSRRLTICDRPSACRGLRPRPPVSGDELRAIWETQPGIAGWFSSVDHKEIGIRYIVTAFAFLAVGGLEALVMRIQLARPDQTLLTPEQYNQLFSMHGMTMIFLYAMPILSGFSNYLWPLILGSRDMAFPRLNALSYWIYVAAGPVHVCGFRRRRRAERRLVQLRARTRRARTTRA